MNGSEAWSLRLVSYHEYKPLASKNILRRSRKTASSKLVTRFQALWRGYIHKKAYPIARLDAIATKVLNDAGLAEEVNGEEVPDLITKRQRFAAVEADLNKTGPQRIPPE